MDPGLSAGVSSMLPSLAAIDDPALDAAIARNRARALHLGVDPDTAAPRAAGRHADAHWHGTARALPSGEVRLLVRATGLVPGTVCLIFVDEMLVHAANLSGTEIFRLKVGPGQRLVPDSRVVIVTAAGILPHSTGGDTGALDALCPERGCEARPFSLSAAARAGKFLTKKGRMGRARYRKPATRRKLAQLYAQLDQCLQQGFGYGVLVSHGTLLGLIREGDLIAHDDDFDCAYVSRHGTCAEVSHERFAIADHLIAAGFDCRLGATGHVKLRGAGVEIDLMPAWFEAGRYCVAGHTAVPMAPADLLPPGQVDFHGVALRIPARPEVFLRLAYGPGWRIPDPLYKSAPGRIARRHRRRFRADQKARPDLL